jgi:hypothetical protein
VKLNETSGSQPGQYESVTRLFLAAETEEGEQYFIDTETDETVWELPANATLDNV